MKKILHISKYYYPYKGGTEQTARDCVNALKGMYDQKVICFNDGTKDKQDSIDEIEVTRAGCIAKIASQSISISYLHLFRKIIKEFEPDIIIFHYPNPFVASFLLKLISTDCKLVLYWHLDITKQRFLKLFFIRQNKKLIKRANKIIATSQAYIDGSQYLSSNREKCVVVPSCINEERLKMTPKAERIAQKIREENKGKIICFSCGRHTKYKGFKYLIKAAHMLDDSFQFYIAGQGEETSKLKNEAGNDEKIHFLGIIDDEELKAYYSSMDIFCFPSVSRNEAFGLTLAEAMYFGKPTVTFSILGSGVNFVSMKDKTGLEVLNRDMAGFISAIKELGNDIKLRNKMGCCGKERVKTLFLYSNYAREINKVIEAL